MYNARYIALKIKSEVGNRYKLNVTVFESTFEGLCAELSAFAKFTHS